MPEAVHLASGKVREIYALDGDRLQLVASDRISTFDVILPTPIPDKGRVLTGMSAFWFARTRELVHAADEATLRSAVAYATRAGSCYQALIFSASLCLLSFSSSSYFVSDRPKSFSGEISIVESFLL